VKILIDSKAENSVLLGYEAVPPGKQITQQHSVILQHNETIKNITVKNSNHDCKAVARIARYAALSDTPQNTGQALLLLWSEDVLFPFMFLDLLVRLSRKQVLQFDLQPCVLLIVGGRDWESNENFVCQMIIILN
jgi:hypothetical protein